MKTSDRIEFHKLKWRESPDEKGNFIITRPATDTTVIIDEAQFDAFHALYNGASVRQAFRDADLDEARSNELISFLQNSSFIRKIGEQKIPDTEELIKPWFPEGSFKSLRFLISFPALVLYLVYIIFGMAIAITHKDILPNVADYNWGSDLFTTIVVNMLLGLALAGFHEAGHFLVTYLVGGVSKLSISTRYVYVVFLTESFNISLLPKGKRILIYIAGMGVEFLIMSTIIMHLAFGSADPASIITRLEYVALLYCASSISWQLNFYLENDLYNVLSEYWHMYNLSVDTKKLLLSKINKPGIPTWIKNTANTLFNRKQITREADDFTQFSKEEKSKLKKFMYFVVIGLILSLLYFILVEVRRDLIFAGLIVRQLGMALYQGDIVGIAKMSISLLIILQFYLLYIYIYRKNMNRKVHL